MLRRQPPYLSGGIDEGITIAPPDKNHCAGYKHDCSDFSLALAALEMRSMKIQSAVFAVILMICSLSSHVAHAIDTFDPAYRETTFLMVEADLRLHLCQLQEFSLYLLPSQATTETESPAPPGSTSQALMIAEEQTLSTVFLCRKEAEETIRARLQAAEHELIERPTAQEKLVVF
jgi:hypothetical protein